MVIIPAIDLKDGRCVRLIQGRAEDCKVYSQNPVDMAKQWADKGAEYLHVVDLDGAFQGKPVHHGIIADIVSAIDIPVEVGGGLRTDADIRTVLDCGVRRAIIGTRALIDPAVLEGMAAEFGDKLVVGIDSRNGQVCVKGWVDETGSKAEDLAVRAYGAGVKTLICTDIATDGMMAGPNFSIIEGICRRVKCDVIMSGGITKVKDVEHLKKLGLKNLAGVIVGKALYEGRVKLEDLIAVAG